MLLRLPTALAAALCTVAFSACDGDPPADDPRGEPCATDRDCDALACVADLDADPVDLAALPLVCGDPIDDGGAAGAPCEQDEDCAHGICVLAGACARACEHDTDCAASARCQAVFARRGPDALQAVSVCVAATDLPAPIDVERRMIEAAFEPPSSRVDLEAAEAGATVLYVLEHSDDRFPNDGDCRPALCVRSLSTRDRAPVELFDAAADYMQLDPPLNPVAVGSHLHPAVVMLPNGSAPVLSTAGYSLELESAQSGDLQLTRISSDASGERLDLNVFYVGALDWQPESDRGPALLADALDVVDEILGQADIFVGELRQIAVPGELPMLGTSEDEVAQGFAVLKPRYGVYIELPGLFRLSAGAANAAINLFFVQEIVPLAQGGEPEAQSGGIPGPLGMHGTGSSGIAISTDMMVLAGDAEMLGRTLAHEIAHYLGLFHTSERDGSVYEPLEDTPECRLDQDTEGNGLSVSDCAEQGADNLMFWAKTTGTILTEQQRAVLKRAAILK